MLLIIELCNVHNLNNKLWEVVMTMRKLSKNLLGLALGLGLVLTAPSGFALIERRHRAGLMFSLLRPQG
jgi:hypothetical protein